MSLCGPAAARSPEELAAIDTLEEHASTILGRLIATHAHFNRIVGNALADAGEVDAVELELLESAERELADHFALSAEIERELAGLA